MTEREAIGRMIRAAAAPPSPDGPGDDGAVLPPVGGGRRVVTTDAMIEGVHFVRAHPPRWLGWKLLAVNLSDVAAMGAQPEGFLVTAALPADMPAAWWEALSAGLADHARQAGAALVGGDVVRSPERVALTVTAWGRTADDQLLRRDGGLPGDLLMVRGPIGRSALGLERWLASVAAEADARAQPRWPAAEPPEIADPCLLAHLRPEPPLAAGPWALRAGAHAGLDLSDGLATDAPRLAEASGLQLLVDLDHLPEDPACAGASADQRALGGEDYALLVLVPPAARGDFEAEGFATVGHASPVPAGQAPGVVWQRAGAVTTLDGHAFEHFDPRAGRG